MQGWCVMFGRTCPSAIDHDTPKRPLGRFRMRIHIAGLLTLLCSACAKSGCLELSEPTPVLSEPTTLRTPDDSAKMLGTLPPGRYEYLDEQQHKAFMTFLVDFEGSKGYVIFNGRTARKCGSREPDPA